MRKATHLTTLGLLVVGLAATAQAAKKSPVIQPVSKRYSAKKISETPDFQRHIVPLFGRLGCNGRACHGSFQGRGGFRLSLFGYDFVADHKSLHDKESPRVDVGTPLESLILAKPTDADNHEGGLRYKKGGWEYKLLKKWVDAGAKYNPRKRQRLVKLQVTPNEINFRREGQKVQLKAVAHWSDGTKEDVTPLCRFKTNSKQQAKITANGLITSNKPGDTHVVVFYDKSVVPIPVMQPVSNFVGNKYPSVTTPTKVDKLVVTKLRKLGIVPSDKCNDDEFLRRVTLDLTGSLPSPGDVEKFLADKSPNKRSKIVDKLLESPAYAAWWTTKLCDFTGNNEYDLRNAFPGNARRGRPSQDWYDWIQKRVAENKPYDDIVAGIVTATSRKKGQSYTDYCKDMSAMYKKSSKKKFAEQKSMPYYWARISLRNGQTKAIAFAYSFLGIRIQCAQCHKHPFDQWSKQDFQAFTGFFNRVTFTRNRPRDPKTRKEYDQILKNLGLAGKRRNNILRRELPKKLDEGKTVPFPELVIAEPRRRRRRGRNRNRRVVKPSAKILGGKRITFEPKEDPRNALMKWLRDPKNPYFAKAFVNRVWATYFNVGIVNPPDDHSLANAPSNKALLDYLAKEFIAKGFDMKWLHREIINSDTYQRSWRPNETNRRDELNFSHAVPRRLEAEVAYDAIYHATSSDDELSELHESLNGRAIRLAGASNRYRRGRNQSRYALSVFGRSTRTTNCDCDRTTEPSLLQTLFTQNDRDMLTLIDRRKGGWMNQIAEELGVKNAAKERTNAIRFNQRIYRQIGQVNRRLQQTRKGKAKNKKKLITRYQKQVKSLRKRLKKVARNKGRGVKVKLTSEQLDKVVKQAYLRTLSRYPKSSELARCKQYIADATDTLNGIRGMFWALLNTKEFIVNH